MKESQLTLLGLLSRVLVDATKQSLSNVKDDATFEDLLAKVQELAAFNGIALPDKMQDGSEATLLVLQPRQRRLPAQLSDSIVMSTTSSRADSEPLNKGYI